MSTQAARLVVARYSVLTAESHTYAHLSASSAHLFQLPGVLDSRPEPCSSLCTEIAASGLIDASLCRQVSRSGPVIVMCPILRDRCVFFLPYQCTLASGTCSRLWLSVAPQSEPRGGRSPWPSAQHEACRLSGLA